MEIVTVVAQVVFVLAVCAYVTHHTWARRFLVHRRVMVNLKTGNAVTGVIVERRPAHLVLRDAELHERATSSSVPMDGCVIIDRVNVDFIQRYTDKG